MHLFCVFASMALFCCSTALHCRVCLRVGGVVGAAAREVALHALLHWLWSLCLWLLWAVLVHSTSEICPRRVRRVPYFLLAGVRVALVCVLLLWSCKAELAACKTLAHPNFASTCDIRPRHCLAGPDTNPGMCLCSFILPVLQECVVLLIRPLPSQRPCL